MGSGQGSDSLGGRYVVGIAVACPVAPVVPSVLLAVAVCSICLAMAIRDIVTACRGRGQSSAPAAIVVLGAQALLLSRRSDGSDGGVV